MNYYTSSYNSNLIEPIPRKKYKYANLFNGADFVNCYEISVLNIKSVPSNFIGKIVLNSNSQYIIESKSLKLYLNSMNFLNLNSSNQNELIEEVAKMITADIERKLNLQNNSNLLEVQLFDFQSYKNERLSFANYENLDVLNLTDSVNYYFDKNILIPKKVDSSDEKIIFFYTNLFRSNCPITNQPDWATISIRYIPNNLLITKESLFKYLLSFRRHNDFHESCIDSICNEIYNVIKPKAFEIFGQFTRRGGIDINPFRYYDPENKLKSKDFMITLIQKNIRNERQ